MSNPGQSFWLGGNIFHAKGLAKVKSVEFVRARGKINPQTSVIVGELVRKSPVSKLSMCVPLLGDNR